MVTFIYENEMLHFFPSATLYALGYPECGRGGGYGDSTLIESLIVYFELRVCARLMLLPIKS